MRSPSQKPVNAKYDLTQNLEIEATLMEMMCRSRNRQMSSEPAGKYIYVLSSVAATAWPSVLAIESLEANSPRNPNPHPPKPPE